MFACVLTSYWWWLGWCSWQSINVLISFAQVFYTWNSQVPGLFYFESTWVYLRLLEARIVKSSNCGTYCTKKTFNQKAFTSICLCTLWWLEAQILAWIDHEPLLTSPWFVLLISSLATLLYDHNHKEWSNQRRYKYRYHYWCQWKTAEPSRSEFCSEDLCFGNILSEY